MAFPATLTSYTNPVGTNTLDSPDHASQHTVLNTVVGTIEAMLGTSSGGTRTFASRNNETFGTPSVTGGTIASAAFNSGTIGTPSVTGGTIGSATLNNSTIGTPLSSGGSVNSATLGTPTIVVSSDATGDLFFRSAGGTLNRLPVGTQGQFMRTAGTPALPSWQTTSFSGAPIFGTAICSGQVDVNSSSFSDITGMTTTLDLGASNYTVCAWSYQGIFGNEVGNQAVTRLLIGTYLGPETFLRIDVAQSAATWPVSQNMRLAAQTGTVVVKLQLARQSGAGTVTAANAHGHILAIAYPE